MAKAGFTELRAKLDTLARRGESHLRRWAFKRAVERATPGAFTAALIVPACFLVLSLPKLVTGTSIWPFSRSATLVLCIVVPLVVVAGRVLFHFVTHPVDRRVSLALFDRQLGCRDRIQAADEFSRIDRPTRFQLAAIHDAGLFVGRALDARLEPVRIGAPGFSAANRRHGLYAVGLLLGAMLIDGRIPPVGAGGPGPVETVLAEARVSSEPDAEARSAAAETERMRAALATPRRARTAADREETDVAAPALHQAANVASAATVSSRSGAGGAVSQQRRSDNAGANAAGQAASPRRPERPPARNRRPQDKQPPSEREFAENDESSSGLTSGQGSSGGSRTAASDKQAAANKAQRDESNDEVYDDAEEEEDEEQQAAAAARPLLNQRKAPVDRSLTPSGNANRENDRANGRSGPGGLKKTRGVAAMLLGVPLPDQLRGQANPGRMKVQRERAAPEAKLAGDVPASDRGEIDGSIGPLAHQGLSPWMQDVVRDYFLAERARNKPTSQ